MSVSTVTPPKTAPSAARARGRSVARLVSDEYFTLLLCVVYFLAMWPVVPEIATLGVLRNVLSDLIPLLVVAIGQTFVLMAAEIDLSVTAVIACASVFGASIMSGQGGYLANAPVAVPVAVLGFLAVGVLVGLFNGVCVSRLQMPSFIVTLTSRMFFAGCALWYTTFHTHSSSISGLPTSFTALGSGEWVGLPASLLLALPLALAAHWVLTRTVYGQWLVAIGINRQTARISGVPVEKVITVAFVISGTCAALGSLIYTARLQTGTPILGERILLDVIGAAVIGGTSLFGGKGKIKWTIFGVLFLVLVDTTLKILGASLFAIYCIKGGVILFAAVIDALRNRLLAQRA